jgi:hypothetical protein
MQCAPESVSHRAVKVEIDLRAAGTLGLQLLTLDGQHGATPDHLPPSFRQTVETAKIGCDRRSYVTKASRDLRTPVRPVAVNE